jgi:squalene-hopene/tetraprenyl-beta-curcumene cyclase
VVSPTTLDQARLQAALARATRELLAARTPNGHWSGELSSSALSTATAVTALATAQRAASDLDYSSLISSGLQWLAGNQNSDGGWGDTTMSLSNLSTTTLCWAAFGAVPGADYTHRAAVSRAESWITAKAGGLQPDKLAPAIIARYGKDRTFSVPILTMCALAGRLGTGREAWRHVIPLPFELAALPHQFFAALRLPVVSYALPALIAIGQARHHHSPSRNPLARLIRSVTAGRTLRVLKEIQPENGGFLEATPLTSFVTMSLAGSGLANHPVTHRGLDFLSKSQRADGSWPIDTNLTTWVTTLAVNALHGDVRQTDTHQGHELRASVLECGGAPPLSHAPGPSNSARALAQSKTSRQEARFVGERIRDWLLAQQYRVEHPYTHAAPGGWAWTDLPGGVPDADDTAGALLALRNLGPVDERAREAAMAGIQWLLNLQNSDGGIPTFCRGWGALPFDRSSADITAHAIQAWLAWKKELPQLEGAADAAIRKALAFLFRVQRKDGSWIPLWFGNQWNAEDENPVYGTARVVAALSQMSPSPALEKGVRWLAGAQLPDGGWGARSAAQSSVEESALAIEALAASCGAISDAALNSSIQSSRSRGTEWLIQRVESGEWITPSPIGFYFARLWYYERLYPMIFTVGALRRTSQSFRIRP